jgi:cellulose synthase/poly-beta-1,6-N-acetylglucosamine synthase-like glycosyltransferase
LATERTGGAEQFEVALGTSTDETIVDTSGPSAPSTSYKREVLITFGSLIVTFVSWVAASSQTGIVLVHHIQAGDFSASLEQTVFILIIQSLIYGNFVYQLTRIGYLRRRLAHAPTPPSKRETLYDGEAPKLAILVPSYKEELPVVQRTLLSAALQDYPDRRVVLLLDDPPAPNNPWDERALYAARALPTRLQAVFNKAAAPFLKAQDAFLSRVARGKIDVSAESMKLACLYEEAALWIESYMESYAVADHGDQLLLDKVLRPAALNHRERANHLRNSGNSLKPDRIAREFRRLAALFSVEFATFERKRFLNLSHEPNKAMNLNSYIRLLGGSWNVVECEAGDCLEPAAIGRGTLNVPAADFLITLDADSLLVPEYAANLVHYLCQPGNERIAVAQTPYNTIPNAPGHLERIAGATTDIQYLIHQGFTHYDATYWVGANALLRTVALADIRTTIEERGFQMPVFIQDRTVIEDTESRVDLASCGWKLFNYPDRLAFSATPQDFGSLLIQRRRWANGGLIILPKLLRYLGGAPSWAKIKEGFFRVHYLGSIALVNLGLLILLGHSFEHCIEGIWLPLTAIPYFLLYMRDLRYSGFKGRDLISVYALNLLLIPVNLGGVFKSLHQAVSGHKIPFSRTPKISGRTSIPGPYCLAELALALFCIGAFSVDFYHQRWAHAAFSFFNGALLAYGIFRLIGFEELVRDLMHWLGLEKTAPRAVAVPANAL